MFRKTLMVAAICGAVFTFSTAVTQAHDGATGVIKERMDMMKLIAKNTKRIAPIAMGSEDMDLKAVEESAGYIAKTAADVIMRFPKGSTSMVSEAKENIWTDWDKFAASMKSLSQDAAALEKLAKEGEEFELTDAFGKMASNCKKCHTDFRMKKE
ncbi:Cytochrome c [Candidatus Terasakiella magnetica]|uniref:Cytochrome c n=1 Tax=Candidatus Terasakiella magnetica TaxID=1867952 RepID=A0A1C3RFL9_9PROT|nr:cytochrome c [Candidatus Terasakiella magnetica]SCA56059.1 Cytochrome c [Candidatus Terasakiella magnetica]